MKKILVLVLISVSYSFISISYSQNPTIDSVNITNPTICSSSDGEIAVNISQTVPPTHLNIAINLRILLILI
mgnify:CR=1 FL=1